METIPTYLQDDILEWEDIVGSTRYGRYAVEVERTVLLKARSLITKPTTALDIGCEGGRWAKLLSDVGWQVICTDINQRSLAICQRRIPTARCIPANPNDSTLPCDTESIGLALCIQVATVINAQWFIDEVFRVLQKSGLLVGVFWNRASWRGILYHSMPALRIKGSGNWYWYPESYPVWRKRLCDRGFTIVYEEGYCWPPFRRNSDSLFVPIATGIEHCLGLRKLIRFGPLVVFIAQRD